MRERIGLIVGWVTMFLIGIDLFVVSPLLPFISEASLKKLLNVHDQATDLRVIAIHMFVKNY